MGRKEKKGDDSFDGRANEQATKLMFSADVDYVVLEVISFGWTDGRKYIAIIQCVFVGK